MRALFGALRATAVIAVAVFSLQSSVAQQSPEEFKKSTGGCTLDSQCTVPSSLIGEQGKDPRCLAPRCRTDGTCDVAILKDKALDEFTPEDAGLCYVYQYRCDAEGKKSFVADESQKKAAREGSACPGDAADTNPCVAHVCKNKACVRDVDTLHGQSCQESAASPSPNVCQNAQCDRGACVPVPDPAIKDSSSVKCGDDVLLDDGCQVNIKRCNTKGQCLEKTDLRSGAECGPPPNNFVAPADLLPQSFKDLFLRDAKPEYTCNLGSCKLEYCGDHKKNRDEACDGQDLPTTAPLGSRCSADCRIVSPDCSAFRQNPNFLEVPNVNGVGTVSYPTQGSFEGPFAEAKRDLESNGYTVEVAWEPGYSGGISSSDSLTLHALALCAWKPEKRPGCEKLAGKPGLKISALGIPAGQSCDSVIAQDAYKKFQGDYAGYESLFTGNNVGYSISPDEPYIYPLPGTSSAPETLTYCEVCYYPECGNGVRTEGEQCDGKDLGPNAQPGDVCSASCTLGACEAKPDEPVTCSIDPITGTGIEIRKTFSMGVCGYEETRTEKLKPQETCQETVIGLTAERTNARAFVAKDGGCEWTLQRETITSSFQVKCSIDSATGQGLQEGSVLNTKTCAWGSARLLRPRPSPTCRETRAGVSAVLKQYSTFGKASGGGCQWFDNAQEIKSGTTPGCTEANSRATLTAVKLVSNMQASPPVCRYQVDTSISVKPQGFCAERGSAAWPKAELVSYVLNKNTCAYGERIDKSTARPSASCSYQSSTKSAVQTTYSFNQAKCAYDPVKVTKPQPANSCTEEYVNNRYMAVKRLYGSSLDPKTCEFRPSVSSEQTPATYECSAGNGQKYSRATLNRDPMRCTYAKQTGSCCGYTLTIRSGLKGETGLKGGAGCLSSVISRATMQCNGRGDMTDDCIAGKVAGTWSADSGCTQLGGSANCGSAQYVFFQSPISLLWSPKTQDTKLSFARFTLSDATSGKVVVWKASGSMPLVVFDPEHKGEIRSAHQLFGNYFRGGRDGKEPWLDGYQALGSLDLNNDEKISGKELDPLGLWFDENRDGVSQSGEVKPLSHHDVNVTALFYKGGVRNDVNRDINLAVGFERINGGHIEQGASVDWYSEEASSQMDLISSLSISSFFARSEKTGDVQSSVAPMTPVNGAPVKQRDLYEWSTEDSFFIDGENHKPQGMFSLIELSDGTIRGHLFGESFLKDGARNVSAIGVVRISGRVETLPDGRRKVMFDTSKDRTDGRDAHSTAIFSADGATLEGETTETLTYEGEERSYSYSWKARKH